MSDQSVARRIQRATGVRYTTALMWVRDPALRDEAGKRQGGSFADRLTDVCCEKHIEENVMAKDKKLEVSAQAVVDNVATDVAEIASEVKAGKKPIVGQCIVCTSPVTEEARCFGCDELVCGLCRRLVRHKLPITHNPEEHGKSVKHEVTNG